MKGGGSGAADAVFKEFREYREKIKVKNLK